jgi:ankyrin repeat protein
LEEIDELTWKYAHRLFLCVAVSSRPFRVEELAEFLAFDFDTDSIPTLLEDWRPMDPEHAVLSICSSLLAIVDIDGSPVVRFAHFSIKEYLTSNRLAKSKDAISRFHVSMTLAHTIMAQACLGVLLNIDENITEDDLKKFPLAEYAAEHWTTHARFEGVSPNIQDGMKRLFDPSNFHFSVWLWIYHPERPTGIPGGSRRPSQTEETPLHHAAFHGLNDVVNFLIVERSQNVDARGLHLDETPLSVASRRGYSGVARALLEHGADTGIRDNDNHSPLDRASQKGHVEVVRVLLEHGADVNSSDKNDCVTALHRASGCGEVAIARILLDYGADPTARDNNDRTPLHYVAEENHAAVARVLLEWGADPNAQDSKIRTPLHLASWHGYLDVVWLLLQHGADTNIRDDEGRTPFQYASARGHQGVMQSLLEHGAEDYRTQ